MTRDEKWKEVDRLIQQAKNDLQVIDKELTIIEHAFHYSSITSPLSSSNPKPLIH